MRKLGYVHNRAAASLRTKRSQTIGLIIPDIANPFFSELTVGIEAQLDEADYQLLLTNTSERTDKQDRAIDTLLEHRADGVLICPAQGTRRETIEQLNRWNLPFVFVMRYLLDVETDYVGADNELGADLAVEHLIGLGHRRIAFIGGDASSSARRDRLNGYLTALGRHGLAAEETLSITSPITRQGGHQAIGSVLAQNDPPTAALCYNDVVAFGVMLGLQAKGRAVGSDFAVVGFDDITEARPAIASTDDSFYSAATDRSGCCQFVGRTDCRSRWASSSQDYAAASSSPFLLWCFPWGSTSLGRSHDGLYSDLRFL